MNTVTTTTIFDSLCEIMSTENFNHEVKAEIESLFNYCREGMEYDSEKFLTTIFLKALNRKISSDVISQNIYESMQGASQIELFNILIDKFPFVKHSQQIINTAIVDILKQNEVVTIIDIGCGLGTQMANIVLMARELTNLKKLVIVGIEPFVDALGIAEKNIQAARDFVNFELQFVAVPEFAEKFDFTSLACLEGKVVVNASLALHHIQTLEKRNSTIASIKAINPYAFILTEPNVNNFESDFFSRFQNSFQHFKCLFNVIDKLEISQQYKNGLKLFFGREIEDIIGKSEIDRFEKHAPSSHWINLLEQNNFDVTNAMLKESFVAKPGVEIKYHNEGFVGFTFQNETALSLIYAY